MTRAETPDEMAHDHPAPDSGREVARLRSENERLTRELAESRKQQAATAEVLRTLVASHGEVDQVFQAVAERAYRLCHASSARVYLVEGETHRIVASVAESNDAVGLAAATPGQLVGRTGPVSPESMVGRTILDRRVLHVEDAHADQVVTTFSESPTGPGYARSRVHVPLLRDGNVIGVIAVARMEHAPFSDGEISLLETFADQAVIAIENARLFQELELRNLTLNEALEQQTATAEVLRVIASSPMESEPVITAILQAAMRLSESTDSSLALREGDQRRVVGIVSDVPGLWPVYVGETGPANLKTPGHTAMNEGRIIHIPDRSAPEVLESFPDTRLGTVPSSSVAVPLMQDGQGIGWIAVVRSPPRAYTERQIALLQTFADQAVIAIRNSRLFQTLGQRTRELTEALERQTATAEILQTIASSPTDLQRVLDAVTQTARQLCDAQMVTLHLPVGDALLPRASSSVAADVFDTRPPLMGPQLSVDGLRAVSGRAYLTGQTVHVRDIEEVADEFPRTLQSARLRGWRSSVAAPLCHGEEILGVLSLYAVEPHSLRPAQIQLLESFASQAAIAVANTRLFQHLEQRTAELTEALGQQTVTSEVLRVIASSPTDLQVVLNTVAESATRLCDAAYAVIFRENDDRLEPAAHFGLATPISLPTSRGWVTGRAFLDRQTVHVPDLRAAADEFPEVQPLQQRAGQRATLSTPLLREGVPIGAINVARMEPHPFTPSQIKLIETFADQAVIAIENARLFQELQERTAELSRSVEELHALGEVGQAVSSSLDLPTVLTTIVRNAARLAGAEGGIVYEYDDAAGFFELRAADQLPDALADSLRNARLRLGEGVVGRAALTRAPVQVEDVADADILTPAVQVQLLAAGLRSILAVPLLREDAVLGGLVLSRRTAGAFPPEVVQLLQTLATQSAIAIHNARLYQTLEAQGQALAEASQHKSQFLANMSHELRTPLNAVIGYSEMLHEELSDLGQDALAPDVERITSAGRHLLGLINDILDLSKIEAGKMDLFLEAVDVGALLRDVATTVEPLMARNGNTLRLTVSDEIDSMYADATKLRQIFFNLLGNAAKFTDHGAVSLLAERESADWLRFTITDSGIGMSDEQMERLFQAFTQAEASTTRRYGGTGLGLTLVRHFAELMGGGVEVSSQPGVGSTFVVRLPAVVTSLEDRARERQMAQQPNPATGGEPTDPDQPREPFVLVVDDDAASRELLRRTLEADGVRVVEATGGEQGIHLARHLQPALITLDVLMPGLDGWAVLGALKGDPATADIPVILLTILDDRDLGYALGAADYLTKPIERDRLLRAVSKHVRKPSDGGGRRALVVEDDPATREMLGRLLQRDGWTVEEAANGRIGLERVTAAPPDLILLDLMMPELDGFGFVERLRAEPAWKTIPVLVITAKDLTAAERLRLNGWVEQVLQKGAYTRSTLFAEVRALVRSTVPPPGRQA